MSQNDFQTSSGITVDRYYGPEGGRSEDLGKAGEYPFTRGIQKTMYRGRLWTMRQYAGFGGARETNQRFRFLLEQGQTGLSTAFDLPTQMGLDADDPKAAGEVGRVGVHIGTIEDMEMLFDGIALGEVSTSLTINSTAPILLALYVAAAKRRGIDPATLRGTVQNDILKEFIARGTYVFPAAPSLRLAADMMQYSFANLPRFNPISISGYHMREAGASAVQEVAFTLANAEVYLKELISRGVGADRAGARLAFFFGCHNHFLEEIAKFRAARRIWAKMMRDDYGAKDPKAQALRFHVQTCGSTLTSQQPRNNVVRVALQAMAAVLGGCQSLHTNAYDEALSLPSRQSAKVALRTQQILAHETGVPGSVDPVGGSFAIETLTRRLEEKIWADLRRIREKGGMLPLIEKGIPQAEIQESAYRHQMDVESGRRKIVGVNCFEVAKKPGRRPAKGASDSPRTLKSSRSLEAGQVASLARFRARRDSAASHGSLEALEQAAGNAGTNLFPLMLDCVESNATLGEICGVLRRPFGEYHGR